MADGCGYCGYIGVVAVMSAIDVHRLMLGASFHIVLYQH